MKVLWLDPVGGVSGDMLLGALVDLGVDPAALEGPLRAMGLTGFRLEVGRRSVMGVDAAKVRVVVDEDQPARTWKDIRAMVDTDALPDRARALALAAFERLARAEAKVHGVPLESVHFHEVGGVDALVDVCGTALGVTALEVGAVHAGPPPLGQGRVKTAHGMLPVPAPATLEILVGVPVATSETVGELTTPTGATLLATLAEHRFGPMPSMVPLKVGYGAGDASWPDRPNVVRAVLGTAAHEARPGTVLVVEANLDDLTPELMAVAAERCLEAGALDVLVLPATMKKGRAGHLLQALCRPEERERVVRSILTHTSSLGVRIHPVERVELPREVVPVETAYGTVRMKVGRLEGRRITASPELEDCRRQGEAAGVAPRVVWAAALAAWHQVAGS